MTLRPPSVVRSSRRSGTRQHALGTWRKAISSISSVAAISRLSGQVELGLQAPYVAVGDVAPVLAQVRGDAVGAGLQREMRGAQRVGMASAARVADGGHVIDVHAQAQMGKRARLTHAETKPEKTTRPRWRAASYDDGAKLGRHSCKYSRRPRP